MSHTVAAALFRRGAVMGRAARPARCARPVRAMASAAAAAGEGDKTPSYKAKKAPIMAADVFSSKPDAAAAASDAAAASAAAAAEAVKAAEAAEAAEAAKAAKAPAVEAEPEMTYPECPIEFEGVTEEEYERLAKMGRGGRPLGMVGGALMGGGSWFALEPYVPLFQQHEWVSLAAWTLPAVAYWGAMSRTFVTSRPVRVLNFEKHMLTAPLYKAMAAVPPVAYQNAAVSRDAAAVAALAKTVSKHVGRELHAVEQTLTDAQPLLKAVNQRNLARFTHIGQLSSVIKRALMTIELEKNKGGKDLSFTDMPALSVDMLNASLNRTAFGPVFAVGLVLYALVGGAAAGTCYYFSA